MSADSPLSDLMPRPVAADMAGVINVARANAPYLSRLLARDGAELDLTTIEATAAACEAELDALGKLSEGTALSMEVASARLRQAKRRVHLLLALLDLAGVLPQGEITNRLTRLADLSLQVALNTALAARGLEGDGLFLIAFGKMGAHELNYSSDVDIAAFFDADHFHGGERGPQEGAIRVVRDVCRLMEEQTAEGYVFRTDLRLRPDPSSTPLAVSTRRAEIYYESVGQNWERMAWIKARTAAGDRLCADRFLAQMQPFVWRRHLDYWALADIHAIKQMINARIDSAENAGAPFDVKLGPGGIREVEFFAQTQQLILGGRDGRLRVPGTLAALTALTKAGVVEVAEARDLALAYEALRGLEHRIQMLEDAQTHTLSAEETARSRVACLMGMPSVEVLNTALWTVRQRVHAIYSDLFASEVMATVPGEGNLVFTGVDDDPGTLETLAGMGFSEPSRVIASFRRWHFGHVPATKSQRGQALLTAITPRLLRAMSATGEPDVAFRHFERFFEGLSSGVQLLAMLNVEEDLLDDLVASLAVAPRLARTLSARPELLESLVSHQPEQGFVFDPTLGFEAAMDTARRAHRDASFLLGHALLNGRITAREAGHAWTDLARSLVTGMTEAARQETERRFGPAPAPFAIMGMGSLGGREMTAGSDLDMLVIYDPGDAPVGEEQTWFSRFTQRLITALSAPTAEGVLYEVDMRLRPSGRAGPVAVRLAAFESYHHKEAWTWEHMALTRMDFVAGDAAVGQRARDIAIAAINARMSKPEIAGDIDDMRARMRAERPAQGPWDMKLSDGGLVDIEFIAQKGLLLTGGEDAVQPQTDAGLFHLADCGWMSSERAEALAAAWSFQMALRQILRLCLEETSGLAQFSSGLKSRLVRAVDSPDFARLEADLEIHRETVLRPG
ncbi:MAG: bifunctional [glutamine synthetase] adenylyltransferase/[glutamine synthetase]-adenylyl-L-tyrosine phosphorylase [Hyphomonadaceae bacterium]|nr:bifunctional [glutamine synthetase] adenylyltransferase/[glutamine synthetase]-adenylyl-L-tyrosine phosphorylase [Hyphomonadaceae bacterium]